MPIDGDTFDLPDPDVIAATAHSALPPAGLGEVRLATTRWLVGARPCWPGPGFAANRGDGRSGVAEHAVAARARDPGQTGELSG